MFVQPYVMTQGGPNNSSLFYTFYLFREAFTFSNMGYACAIAWVLFIVVLVFTAFLFKTARKWVYYEGGGHEHEKTRLELEQGFALRSSHSGLTVLYVSFYWLVRSSMMDLSQIFLIPPKWIPEPFVFENFYSRLKSYPLGAIL